MIGALGGDLQMETSITEKIKKFADKIGAEIKSFYDKNIDMKFLQNKYKNIDMKSLQNKYKGFDIKFLQNKYKNVDFKSLYNQCKEDKKTTYKIAGGAVALTLVTFPIVSNLNASTIAYNVEVNENVLAIVRTEEEFLQALEEVKLEAFSIYGQEVVLSHEPSFTQIKTKKSEITEPEDIVKNIKEQIDIKAKGIAIKVNGENIAIVKDENIANSILDSIKDSYVGEDDTQYDFIDFIEKVEIVEVATEFGDIMNKDEALKLIAIGTDEEKIHEIESGENTWTIARKYDLKMDDIAKANPTINLEKLKIGQKISLVIPKPLVSVKTKEYVELVEEIPFETEYVATDVLYKGDKKITVQGEEGKRELKAYIVKTNGFEIDREVVEEKILNEPKTRVIAEGTKPRPATMATGAFLNPTRGSLTSPFGMRWGRRHTGIDIASSKGTAVAAADAGKVSHAGPNGAYGNLVIVDHENGYQTYYAHNSKIVVKKGDRVYKGQKLAEMGSSGRSTGVHLHFEVRKNGTPVNPQKFVKY